MSEQAITAQSQEKNVEMDGKYLTFFTENQLFGISIADVVQIVGIQQITPIPEFPCYAKGVINLRGNIIPVIDMRLRLGKEEKEHNERTCIIITLIGETAIGFIVDAVDAVTSIDDEYVSQPPTINGSYGESYLTGIARLGDKVVLLMNIAHVLSEEVVSALATGE